jgi:adenosylcobinamide-phosphate synthase
MDVHALIPALPLILGWAADRILGDPARWPHPVVGFGAAIAAGEKALNRGRHRVAKGAFLALSLIGGTWALGWGAMHGVRAISPLVETIAAAVLIFYCLAGTTLAREVRAVFGAVDRSVDEGRRQVGRIVGRDTSALDAGQIRTAALETLAENLNDGVIAPLFWYGLLGVPGMLAYKMVNTLDSMIGYRTERYRLFGRWAARIDDAAGYLPARLTALLMLAVAGRPGLTGFVFRQGHRHKSPNSGYPEAALAGILGCRFGGPNTYFGQRVEKPYIGTVDRPLTDADLRRAIRVNRWAEAVMVLIVIVVAVSMHIS